MEVGNMIDYEELLKQMCNYYINIMEGDTYTIDEAYKLMQSLGYVDKEGFPLDKLYE